MSNHKKIDVSFINRLPFDDYDCPSTNIHMGQITSSQLNAILAEFKKNAPSAHACIKTMLFEFKDCGNFDWPLERTPTRFSQLNLSDMFPSYDFDTDRITAPCMIGKKRPQTKDAMVNACANNLRCGKCREEFIRRTLGAALFPQFYAKDKQK